MSIAPPQSLSPSRASAFRDCPLAFRLRSIDHLPEEPSPHAVKGTLVHSALESLFWEHPRGERTLHGALAALEHAWSDLQRDPQFIGLSLDEKAKVAFYADARLLVENYFVLEDPNEVEAVGVELRVSAKIDRVWVRGIIDRLDRRADGRLVIVDYKTGRAPSEHHETAKMTGVYTYAFLCEAILGERPAEVRLLYLRKPTQIASEATPAKVDGERKRTLAIYSAIERSCARGEFSPSPGPLCKFCSFHAYCPTKGNQPPPLDQ